MIYLFEDKEGRMELFLKETIDDGFLKKVVMNCKIDEITSYIEDHFSDADLVLFHKSYIFPQSGVTNEAVREAFLAKGIPFVYFSGQSSNSVGRTEKGIQTADVRSEDMYLHLPDFIQDYKQTGKANIPLLVFGKDYLMNTLLKVLEWVNNKLWSSPDGEPMNMGQVQIIRSGINARMPEDELKDDRAALIKFIDEHRAAGDLTPSLLLGQIQRIIDQH